jgi:hypothetical protein
VRTPSPPLEEREKSSWWSGTERRLQPTVRTPSPPLEERVGERRAFLDFAL